MIKIKHVFIVALFSIAFYACGDDNDSNAVEVFDHEAQALIDKDSLASFFTKHYYDTTSGLVKPLIAGETALSNDSNLKSQEVTEQEVDYTFYYYKIGNEGSDPDAKGNPSVVDSVYAKYNGVRIVDTDSISTSFDSNTSWFTLDGVIRGWSYSFPNFKGGENVSSSTPGEPINFINGGKGILFIPSGLGYRNVGTPTGSIPGNANLIFYIELWDIVANTDHDQDGIPSIEEDLDGDGDPRNDDTDENFVANYVDADDDGDGKLTKDEDRNGDGDPRNDFNDPDNPTLPDYLNPNIFG
ncbi:hypothetical protein LPB136_04120 [Tenacibaculum todarodis]|uniref:peptidylprolyl isomerase n=1 Tax=Tenacibaculum todarodis TaxID=1850252 RepID=A0A1L3JHQ3_9FLAO|nr:FKBP-type peptidyl-prolyl cis-trans isomerase [Tenacibaculum todarodis]APG64603.1 hypothetical protein LPB136_04120 [Tenacibaculum todarodis]